MNDWFAKLGLRPHEQRLLVVIFAVIFVLLNALLVWPQFGAWGETQQALQADRQTLKNYEREIQKTPQYAAQLRALENQGSAVLPEDQANALLSTIQSQAQQANIVLSSIQAVNLANTATNDFFDKKAVRVSVATLAKPLVDFLYSLGRGNSMIRVSDLDLRIGAGRYELNGKIDLIASYQRKAPAGSNVVTKPAPSRSARANSSSKL